MDRFRRVRALLLTILPVLVAAPLSAQRARAPWGEFDAWVARGVRAWGIPGLAVAVVQGDSVVFAKGYGVRTLGTADSVTPHTLFANASTTKAFTALAAAILADEGRLPLDARVADLHPGFALADPVVARDLTVRDLLSHRAGFGDPGYLWYGRDFPTEEIVRRMRFIRPTSGLRVGYAYNNATYALAGLLIGRADSSTWADAVRRRILEPLGMGSTVPVRAGLAGRADLATSHQRVDDSVRAIGRYDLDNIAPAGSMYSSAMDMTRWLRFLVAGGVTPSGQRLVSEARFADLFRPQVLIPQSAFYPTAELVKPRFTAYGLGWFLHDYRGEFAAFHTGSIDGMTAQVGLLPDRKTAFVVFANLDQSQFRHAVMYRVFDIAMGGPMRDWSAEFLALYGAREQAAAAGRARRDSSRLRGTAPSLPPAEYAGAYADSLFGEMVVREEGGRLVMAASAHLAADLEHWHQDTFRAVYRHRWLGDDLVTFRLGQDGRVAALDLGNGMVLARRR